MAREPTGLIRRGRIFPVDEVEVRSVVLGIFLSYQ